MVGKMDKKRDYRGAERLANAMVALMVEQWVWEAAADWAALRVSQMVENLG